MSTRRRQKTKPTPSINQLAAESMTEEELRANVIQLADMLGWRAYGIRRSDLAKIDTPTGEGYPDLTLARDGTVLFVELKSQTGRLSPHQHNWSFHLVGIGWRCWRPSDWIGGRIERELA